MVLGRSMIMRISRLLLSFFVQVHHSRSPQGSAWLPQLLPLLTSLWWGQGSQYILICQLLWADFPRNPTQQLPLSFISQFSPMATPSCKRLARWSFSWAHCSLQECHLILSKRKLRLQESGTLPKISPTVGQSQHLDGGLPSSNARVLCLF